MAEAIPLSGNKFRLINQLGRDEFGEMCRRALRQQGAQSVDVEAGPDHRGRVQNRLRLSRQSVDASGKHGLYRHRHGDLVDVTSEAVATAIAGQHAAARQVADDLLDEERVSHCRNGDPLRHTGQR